MTKVDLKNQLRELFNPPKHDFADIAVPTMDFVKIDGAGDPNTAPAYRTAVEWLYGVSYAMKFAAKNGLARDYVVPPLEALWWSDDPGAFACREKDRWQWTVMIMAPDFATGAMFEDAVAKTLNKRNDRPSSLRFEPYAEGRSLQILHIGSYDDEGPVLKRLHEDVMPGLGVTFAGPHHEIYLSDPRKTEPAKLKTILRQPVRAI
ncbi:GyrI-like domain-containing protein [Brevundimonas sp. SL130]|uniref:GyrI-like domain-containing protein n=1 Tax=Brevundimonas sp. SL130 TaxID=2995143 RepID=UPI00226C86F7|nr:GyrI-like domain-containing protein [Brevundimonas sp. SL130]WAC58606.1 GyrI-like domain-containing protein [Brevundimonas sp. SL130]